MATPVLVLLVVAAAVAIALATHAAVHRRVPLAILEAHHTVAGHLLAIVGGMFGILLAFAVVVVWSQYDRAREGASQEANAAADLLRIALALPEPAGSELRGGIVAYLDAVIGDEWPRLADDGESHLAHRQLEALARLLGSYQPVDDRTRNLHLVALQRLDEMADRREDRLDHAFHRMPRILWAVLLVSAVATVGFANLFGMRYHRSQALMLAVLAGLVALSLTTVAILDQPYSGSSGIRPDDLEAVLLRAREG